MKLITTRVLSEMSGVPEYEIRSLARVGALDGERHGSMWVFDHDAIDQLEALVGDQADDDGDEAEAEDYVQPDGSDDDDEYDEDEDDDDDDDLDD